MAIETKSQTPITWNVTSLQSPADPVKIELTYANSPSSWVLIADNQLTGTYNWTVPSLDSLQAMFAGLTVPGMLALRLSTAQGQQITKFVSVRAGPGDAVPGSTLLLDLVNDTIATGTPQRIYWLRGSVPNPYNATISLSITNDPTWTRWLNLGRADCLDGRIRFSVPGLDSLQKTLPNAVVPGPFYLAIFSDEGQNAGLINVTLTGG
ncbi:hypothetical protein HK104_011035, partial [Borealophlyctis nickersoniae]